MTTPDPSDDPRDIEQRATRREPAARPQASRGVLARISDPAPAWTQVATCALVVLVMIQIAIFVMLIYAPPYILVRGG